MTKQELAKLYFPALKKKQAVRKLRKWINNNQDLCRTLAELGYDHSQGITPKQIEAIYRYLGEPG